MTSRRVLYVTPYVPSPIRVRPYNLIKSLLERGHHVQVLALQTSPEEAADAERLRALGAKVSTVPLPLRQSLLNCARAPLTGWPLQAAFTCSPDMNARLRAELAGAPYDVVHVEHLRGAQFGLACQGHPAVWDAVDCISLLLERTRAYGPSWKHRLAACLDLPRTRRYEARAQSWYARVLVTSPEDCDALRNLARTPSSISTSSRVVVLANGVDLAYFAPQEVDREADTLIFTGKMSYHANIAAALDLAQQVMPRVWRQRPGVRLRIVGKDPPAQIRRLAQNPRIEVTGTVPDLRPHLARASLAVCPLRYGVGIQNKILEAMALGTPVVADPQVCRALAVRPGKHLLVGEGPDELARHILVLLERPDLARALGRQGRRYVEEHHNWQAVAARLENVYEEVIAQWPEGPNPKG